MSFLLSVSNGLAEHIILPGNPRARKKERHNAGAGRRKLKREEQGKIITLGELSSQYITSERPWDLREYYAFSWKCVWICAFPGKRKVTGDYAVPTDGRSSTKEGHCRLGSNAIEAVDDDDNNNDNDNDTSPCLFLTWSLHAGSTSVAPPIIRWKFRQDLRRYTWQLGALYGIPWGTRNKSSIERGHVLFSNNKGNGG
uniref:Uncharacterized protein n=1 Tax=Vespula pensylvanica TaxID=30213 RepID=A0A834P2J1_VESPE|nr:hypothetical protein H0235_008068 [Vespula pensylvanica]